MAKTTFSGPVQSDNGFIGVVDASSANIDNLVVTTLTIGSTKITSGSAVSGAVSAQLGYIPVMIGSTTAYIGLYKSLTL